MISFDHMVDKGHKCEVGKSIKAKRRIGKSAFNKNLTSKNESLSSDEEGLVPTKLHQEGAEKYVEDKVLHDIIRNAMIIRDEEKEFELAEKKEKTRSEVNQTKKLIKQMSGTYISPEID